MTKNDVIDLHNMLVRYETIKARYRELLDSVYGVQVFHNDAWLYYINKDDVILLTERKLEDAKLDLIKRGVEFDDED